MKLKAKKNYSLTECALYKLRSKKRLALILQTPLQEVNQLIKRGDRNYSVFGITDKKTGKKRKCECPKNKLEKIHRRIFKLLSRVTPPDYLHSGIKGRSYITNAEAHLPNNRMFTMDIQKFYPSTKGWHVFDFFHNILFCSKDVSYKLTALLTYQNHVPTGSPASQIIAFYAHYNMFNDIANLTAEKQLTMTCYVDDIAISGTKASKFTRYEVRGLLKKRKLTSASSKERYYNIGKPKHITGSTIIDGELCLPNKKHQTIYETTQCILKMDDSKEKLALINSNLGRINAAMQSEKNLSLSANRLYNEKKRLEKLLFKNEYCF